MGFGWWVLIPIVACVAFVAGLVMAWRSTTDRQRRVGVGLIAAAAVLFVVNYSGAMVNSVVWGSK